MLPSVNKPATNIQWNAIQNGANNNSLVSQLFAGKPKTQSPNVVAAASKVQSPSVPQTTFGSPLQNKGGNALASTVSSTLSKNTPTFDPASVVKNQGLFNTQTPPPPQPSTPVKSQTITNADGSSTATTYHTPDTSTVTKSVDDGTQKDTITTAPVSLTNPDVAANGTANNQASPGQQNQPTSTFSSLLGGAASAAKGNQAIGESAADIAERYGKEYADVGRKGANAQSGYLTTGTTPVAEGNAAVQAQNTAAQQTAIAEGEQAALQGTGQRLTAQQQEASALNTAAGTAAPGTAFAQVPYSSQLVDANGKPVTGASGGSLTDAIGNVTKQLQSGQIGYDDAKAQLTGYGQAGLNAISKWAADNNFNIAQSNTLAAQQGAITPNLNYATATLDNLKNAMSNLQVWGQNSNIPILGGLSNWYSYQTGQGKQQTSTKAGAVGEAQQAIASVLASIKGGTPTDYGSQARALLPDNPTPADVDAAKANLTALGAQKQSIYSNPGQQGQSSGSGGTPMFGNFNGN